MNESARIACCIICTLAECMKDCQSCTFKAGLAVKASQAEQDKQNTVFTQPVALNHFVTSNLAIIQD